MTHCPRPGANGYPLRHDLNPRLVSVAALKPLGQETRKHPKGQIRKLAASLAEFGFVAPLLIDANLRVIAGWGLVEAARRLDIVEVPCITITDLSEAQTRALRLALNRLTEDSRWDTEALRAEFGEILSIDKSFDLTFSGFEIGEIDLMLGDQGEDKADALPEVQEVAVSRVGDLWLLGDHRLYCGDATRRETYKALMNGRKAHMAFTDPPYNVRIEGNVSGLGEVSHQEFCMASGEMSADEFTLFLTTAFKHMAFVSEDGSIHFACMDWRHVSEMMTAGNAAFSSLKNICVWNKASGAMGSLYRSKHELVFVWKKGTSPHRNNVDLGRSGRNRTNVWDYAGMNSFGSGRAEELTLHPTVKPVALVADAILDVSKPGEVVLDPFSGSGSTILAAERTRRLARAIEFEPKFVDVAIRRFEAFTGTEARLAGTEESFAEIVRERHAVPPTS